MKLVFTAEVSVYYNEVSELAFQKPKFNMDYGCLFRHEGNPTYVMSGTADVSIKKNNA